jgi:hypothetical protein
VLVKPPRDREQLVVVALAAELAHDGLQASWIANTRVRRDVFLGVCVVDLAESRSGHRPRRARVPLDLTAGWRA